MRAQQIGTRLFTDSVERAVYLDGDGRQYVLDGKERIQSVWIRDESAIADVPTVVPMHRQRKE